MNKMKCTVETIFVIFLFVNIHRTDCNVIVERSEVKDGAERAFGQQINQILEDLRLRMHMDMTDSIGLPPLDPFGLDYIKINPEDTDLGATIIAQNIVAVGLNKFVASNADFNLFTQAFTLDLHIPELMVTGDYEAFGLIGGLFYLHGNGPLNIVLHDLNINITGKVHLLSRLSMEVAVDVSFGSIDIELDGLMGGGELNEYFNSMLSETAQELFDEYWPDLKPVLDGMISQMGSDILSEMTLSQLLDIISGNTQIFPEIEPQTL